MKVSREIKKEEAIKKSISRYVTINSEFNNRGLSLSSKSIYHPSKQKH